MVGKTNYLILVSFLIIIFLTSSIVRPIEPVTNQEKMDNEITNSSIQIDTNIIWNENETIELNSVLTIQSNENLIINPGVTVIMGVDGGLRIYGNLSSNGREGLPVIITKQSSNSNWGGRVEFSGSYSNINYTIFEYLIARLGLQTIINYHG